MGLSSKMGYYIDYPQQNCQIGVGNDFWLLFFSMCFSGVFAYVSPSPLILAFFIFIKKISLINFKQDLTFLSDRVIDSTRGRCSAVFFAVYGFPV